MSEHSKRRGNLAQGIYGLVIGFACLAVMPLGLPLSIIALVPAALALGFGASHIREALQADETLEQH